MTACESVRGTWGGVCPDCGKRLPEKLPWSHGRPCERTAMDRGHGWDGRPLPDHTEGNVARWSTRRVGRPPGVLTERQIEIARIVAKHGRNQAEAAAELGISRASVTVSLKRYRTAASA